MSVTADQTVVELYRQYARAKDASAAAVADELEQRARELAGAGTLVARYQASVADALAARLRNKQLGEPLPRGYQPPGKGA